MKWWRHDIVQEMFWKVVLVFTFIVFGVLLGVVLTEGGFLLGVWSGLFINAGVALGRGLERDKIEAERAKG